MIDWQANLFFLFHGSILFYWMLLWILHFVGLWYGTKRLHKPKRIHSKKLISLKNEESNLPGVSIIKPICMAKTDPSLISNLETFFTLDYPKYELLICVQEKWCKEISLTCDKLCVKYPHVECRIFFGGERIGVNPKINNMYPAYAAARYELILVSDSGIRMNTDTLRDMVQHMSEGTGLVHQMPFVCDRDDLLSCLEKVYFGTYHARMYLTANFLGINCATGMSSLMRKSVLDKAGGLKAFSCYLAEDFFMAETFLRSGLKLDICSQPAQQNHGNYEFSGFFSRIIRWTKLRAAMCPHLLLLEPISDCIAIGLIASWSSSYLFLWEIHSVLLIHMLAWFLCDWILLHVVQNGPVNFNKFEFFVMWLLRELSAPVLFFLAMANPNVQWKDQEFRLRWGGVAEKTKNNDLKSGNGDLLEKRIVETV